MTDYHATMLDKISSLNLVQQKKLELFVDFLSKADPKEQGEYGPLLREFNKNLGEALFSLLNVDELIGSPELFEDLVTSVDSAKAKKYDANRVDKHIQAHIELCRTIQSLILLFNYAGTTKKTLNVVEQGFDFKSGSYIFTINPFLSEQ